MLFARTNDYYYDLDTAEHTTIGVRRAFFVAWK
jgi:hypothetical protein